MRVAHPVVHGVGEERDNETEALRAENARLREALEAMLEPILVERLTTPDDHYTTLPDDLHVDTGATYGDVRQAIKVLSDTDSDWLTRHDTKVRREAIEQFVERVNHAAEFAMEKTGKLEGAHYAGMQLELAALREAMMTPKTWEAAFAQFASNNPIWASTTEAKQFFQGGWNAATTAERKQCIAVAEKFAERYDPVTGNRQKQAVLALARELTKEEE